MKIYDRMKARIEENGVSPDVAEEILQRVVTHEMNKPMLGRWQEDESGYPTGLIAVTWLGVKAIAKEYIEESCPMAWFRPMFDGEHPMWEEYEKYQAAKGTPVEPMPKFEAPLEGVLYVLEKQIAVEDAERGGGETLGREFYANSYCKKHAGDPRKIKKPKMVGHGKNRKRKKPYHW